MVILGLNIFHAESSACIIVDGQIIAACEEERFSFIKNYAGFPKNAIEYCLKAANLKDINDVDIISVNSNKKYNLKNKIKYFISKILKVNFIPRMFFLKKKLDIYSVIYDNLKVKYKNKIHHIPHHKSHIASAFYASGMEEALGLSFDAAGDFSTTETYLCNDKKNKLLDKVIFPHSLGIFYQAMTQFIGFKKYGEEFKFMGLAAYGKPKYVDEIRKLFKEDQNFLFSLDLKYFRHQKIGFSFNFDTPTPYFDNLYSRELENLLGPGLNNPELIGQREMDIAHSTQLVFEEIVINILNKLYEKYNIKNLVLAGGCAFNSSLNGKIIDKTKFENIYIPSNCGDAGGALGAAFDTLFNYDNKNFKRNIMETTSLGPSYNNDEIFEKVVRHLNKNINVRKIDSDNELFNYLSDKLIDQKVMGWFQGRMEYGPRSLGNRSILADPRNSDMKNIINLKIKNRESFRPFAPSILEEKVNQYFYCKHKIPFMNEVIKVKENMIKSVPAITHEDGTARVQTVSKKSNNRYYNLIETFYKKTSIPILLNTSLNIQGPICEKPEDAAELFFKSELDILVMENWVFEK